ncbi:LamB/YcsF family protein [Lentzea sp. PSKA42]|uniref:5-oxoprolinase subunit A n=1 Tax=Lentzea indica TaxID=2604800 RepID=A0ABX1FGT7_9PSEU|nr:5-oxoprolinase subunit PxpA [Lentzea indica]NKE58176.1 LamB/YcsF family protein [Lentzea indica]
MTRISLNADVGEGYGLWNYGDDEELLKVVTDANVACGFHGGDPDVLRRTCATAAAHGVRIGAHPGFQDLRGFGRRHVELPRESLVNDVLYQLGALAAIAGAEGVAVNYVKPHGALYHSAVAREEYAAAVVEAVRLFDSSLPLLCQPGTRLARHAEETGLRVLAEGFIDRRYTGSGLLVPRGEPGAVIAGHDDAVAQAVRLAVESTVEAQDGTVLPMRVDSLCVHSDSPGAAEFARATRAALEAAGVSVMGALE